MFLDDSYPKFLHFMPLNPSLIPSLISPSFSVGF